MNSLREIRRAHRAAGIAATALPIFAIPASADDPVGGSLRAEYYRRDDISGQDLDGPQLETDEQWIVGLQKSF